MISKGGMAAKAIFFGGKNCNGLLHKIIKRLCTEICHIITITDDGLFSIGPDFYKIS